MRHHTGTSERYVRAAKDAEPGLRSPRRDRRRLRPGFLELERRQLLSTFTVNSTADDGSTGTLRWAIIQANSTSGPNTIDFDSTVFGQPQTIALAKGQLRLSNT